MDEMRPNRPTNGLTLLAGESLPVFHAELCGLASEKVRDALHHLEDLVCVVDRLKSEVEKGVKELKVLVLLASLEAESARGILEIEVLNNRDFCWDSAPSESLGL